MNEVKEYSWWTKGLAVPLAIVFIVIPLLILDAYILQCLWRWFIVPVFATSEHSVIRELRLIEAMGISLIIGFLTNQYIEHQNHLEVLKMMILRPLIYLGTGCWIHIFM